MQNFIFIPNFAHKILHFKECCKLDDGEKKIQKNPIIKIFNCKKHHFGGIFAPFCTKLDSTVFSFHKILHSCKKSEKKIMTHVWERLWTGRWTVTKLHQGSIFTPTIFLLYINDFPKNVICKVAIGWALVNLNFSPIPRGGA